MSTVYHNYGWTTVEALQKEAAEQFRQRVLAEIDRRYREADDLYGQSRDPQYRGQCTALDLLEQWVEEQKP